MKEIIPASIDNIKNSEEIEIETGLVLQYFRTVDKSGLLSCHYGRSRIKQCKGRLIYESLSNVEIRL